jgi:uncharacterized phage infection (PIP) family protein YhgE
LEGVVVDVQTIDQQYQQLQTQAQQTSAQLQTLAGKLQAAAQSGDQNAREWLLDLKEVALAIQTEQNQVMLLLQALHGFIANHPQPQAPGQWPPAPQPGYPPPQPVYPGQPGFAGQPQQGGMGGVLGTFLNSGFGRAIEMGAGFGIGDDLINKIF